MAPAVGAHSDGPSGGGKVRRSSLERGITRRAGIGLGLQVLLVLLVVGSTVPVALAGIDAVAVRHTEVAAANLLAAMADQQTGLLTLLKPTQPDSSTLYPSGRERTEAALAALRTGAAGTADARQVGRVETTVRNWERWAEAQYARHEPLTDPDVKAEGRHLFGTFSAAQRELVGSLDAEARQAADRITAAAALSVAIVVGDSLVVALAVALFAMHVVGRVLAPLKALATTAEQVAEEGMAPIPFRGRADEVGELALALEVWQETAAIRTVVAQQAPVGISRIGTDGEFLMVNAALERMLAYGRGELVGKRLWDLLHPDDQPRAMEAVRKLMDGAVDVHEVESRWLRRDGTVVWCAVAAAPVLGADGRPETLVGILEDITERRRQAERAASIQRDLLPKERLPLEGYQLAAACVPMKDVAGDFYDWLGPEDGHIDLTVADVMGKEVGSALVMATLGMALRAMPRQLGPGPRVQLVARSLPRGLTDDGLFVTMFHARLDLDTGLLHYVDAGHGYCVIRRAGGQIEPLASRSLPLGVLADEAYEEGRVQLEPGDTLLVYTDGLVEVNDQIVGVDEVVAALHGAETAEEMVERLVARVRDDQADDVTVLLLRRLAEVPSPVAVGGAAAR